MTELQGAIRALAEEAGSQSRLAIQSGLSVKHIWNIAAGKKGVSRDACLRLGLPEHLATHPPRGTAGVPPKDPGWRPRGYHGQRSPDDSADQAVRTAERERIDAERLAVIEALTLKAQRSRRRRPAQQDGYRRAWIREHMTRERRIGRWAGELMADPSSGG